MLQPPDAASGKLQSKHNLAHTGTHRHTQLAHKHIGAHRHKQAHTGTHRHTQAHTRTHSHTLAHTRTHWHTGTHPLSLSMKLIGHDEGHQHIVVTYKRVSRAICPSIRHSHLAINNHLYDSLPKLTKVLLGLECTLSELVTNQSVPYMQNLITSC